ncbi:hypothetical protein F4824DRAFT_517968 [Ustulina deusta]|nr:hypothetical protein F4824DRAFT_517968 [Ustulina deusta]
MENNISAVAPFPPDSDPGATTLGREGSDTAATQTADSSLGTNSSDVDKTPASPTSSDHNGCTSRYDEAWFERMRTWKPPYDNSEDKGGHDSDDSCASHDSFSVEEKTSPESMRTVAKVASYSRLETLPSELRTQILSSIPDLETLRSMIHASPTMHAQYLYNRHRILSACLDRELDGFYVDAYANLKSRASELGWLRTNKTITDFLDSYECWLQGWDSYPCAKLLPPSRVRWMATYYMSVARPLVRRYSSWALENFEAVLSWADSENTSRDSHNITTLSRSEEIRIFRALYRHETYNHLFGQNMGSRDGGFSEGKINEIFFGLFYAWESESIGCFDKFLRKQWGEIFGQVRDDIRPDQMNWRHCGGIFDEESYDLHREASKYKDGMISRGLKVLMRVLAIDNDQNLVAAMERCLMSSAHKDAGISQTMRTHYQSFGARDPAEQRRSRIAFHDDSWPLDGPPLAWVALWGGRNVNNYGDATLQTLIRGGYVMWDAERW